MRDERGPWYLLTGLVIGAILGVLAAWMVSPVRYINTLPDSLRADFKDRYRALIASAYRANGDLVRAQARLVLLKDEDPNRALAEQAQRTLGQGGSPDEASALGMLAAALGSPPVPVASPARLLETATPTATVTLTPPALSATPLLTSTLPAAVLTDTVSISMTLTAGVPPTVQAGTPRPTRSPTSTSTPLPTRTHTPTPGAPFVLKSMDQVCDPELLEGLLQVETLDASEQPVPGVEIIINWDGGENHFFTGVKLEISPGYADFIMTPGMTYILRLAEGGQPVPNLSPSECETKDGQRYWGAWRLVFVQP